MDGPNPRVRSRVAPFVKQVGATQRLPSSVAGLRVKLRVGLSTSRAKDAWQQPPVVPVLQRQNVDGPFRLFASSEARCTPGGKSPSGLNSARSPVRQKLLCSSPGRKGLKFESLRVTLRLHRAASCMCHNLLFTKQVIAYTAAWRNNAGEKCGLVGDTLMTKKDIALPRNQTTLSNVTLKNPRTESGRPRTARP